MKYISILIIVLFLSGCGLSGKSQDNNVAKDSNMKLTSANFTNGSELPKKYSCDGENIAPNLAWSDFPSETKSFALTLEDPDAPSGTFTHWMMINIPANVTFIPEGTVSLADATMIVNDGGESDYVSPCPPSGIHRYIFKIFALNIEKLDGITKNNSYEKIKPYTVGQAELEGKYGRN